MAEIKALVIAGSGDEPRSLQLRSIPKPKPGPHQVLVKISTVAQNPTDIQSFDGKVFEDGAVLGCDFVGYVEELGPDVTRLKKGDHIAGLIWGGEIIGLGAFSEYTVADEKICFKVPPSLSPEAAATVPLTSCTAWLGLFSKDCLAIDAGAGHETVLVWSGNTSVGRFTIQLAAVRGLDVVTTCSPKYFDEMKRLGAKCAFDYRDPDVIGKIKQAAPGLKYVFDTIGNEGSSALASQAVTESGGRLCTVRPGKTNTENVTTRTEVTDVMVWTAFFKEHRYGPAYWPPHEEDHKLCAELFDQLTEWLSSGKVEPSQAKSKGGLEQVAEGFQEHRDGVIAGYKLVYSVG